MKKVFTRIQKQILKHKKFFIYGILTLFIGQIGFFGLKGIGIGNEVFAAPDETQEQSASISSVITEKYQTVSFIQKIIYSLIYPFLVIDGTLVDNSFVYGEIFKIDVLLRNMWNIIRNLANYTLGFIFIYKIFKYLTGSEKSENIKKFLVQLLIAGIGIQASRFIMATLIDASTILTYSIGGLPFSILGSENSDKNGNNGGNNGGSNEVDDKNPYVLKQIMYIDVNNIEEPREYLTNIPGEDIYIAECQTFILSGHEILLAPKTFYYEKTNEKNEKVAVRTMETGCHYGGQVYYFSSLYPDIEFPSGITEDYKSEQTKYISNLNVVIPKIKELTGEDLRNKISEAILLEKGNAHESGGIQGAIRTGVYSDANKGLDVNNKVTGEGRTKRLKEIPEENSYVGVFTQLYSSLKHSGESILANEGSEYSKLLRSALSLGHIIAIGIPLIVVGVIFMIRIGILWIAIIMSPFIVIMTAFDDIGKAIQKNVKSEILECFEIKNLIGIIFSPAIVCLAVSLSTVIFTIISKSGALISSNSREPILGGLIQLNIDGIGAGVGNFVIAVLGIAITRFLVRAAVKASKIGKWKIITDLEKLAKTSLGSIPIVPVPGKDGKGVNYIGANTAFGLTGQSALSSVVDNIKQTYEKEDNAALQALINTDKTEENAKKNAKANRLNQYISGLGTATIGENWMNDYSISFNDAIGETEKTTFNSLNDDEKKKVLEAINTLDDKNQREKFKTETSIKIGDKERVFNSNEYKFVEQEKK